MYSAGFCGMTFPCWEEGPGGCPVLLHRRRHKLFRGLLLSTYGLCKHSSPPSEICVYILLHCVKMVGSLAAALPTCLLFLLSRTNLAS